MIMISIVTPSIVLILVSHIPSVLLEKSDLSLSDIICIKDLIPCKEDNELCVDGACQPRRDLHTGSCFTSEQCPEHASCLKEVASSEYTCSCRDGFRELRGACYELNYCEMTSDCRPGQRCAVQNCEFERDFKDDEGAADPWFWYFCMFFGFLVIMYGILTLGRRFRNERNNRRAGSDDGPSAPADEGSAPTATDGHQPRRSENRSGANYPVAHEPAVFVTLNGINITDGQHFRPSRVMDNRVPVLQPQTQYEAVPTSDAPPPFDPPPAYEDVDKSHFVHLIQ